MKRLHFRTIDSTHLYAKRSIEKLKGFSMTVITADFQTGGIGRKRDRWIAKEGSSLLVSIVYKAPKADVIPTLSKRAADALKAVLKPLNLDITFKYPNDLMVSGKKLSGIISECTDGMMITSLGLNIAQTKDDLKCIDQPATSLFIETEKNFDSEKILEQLKRTLFTTTQTHLLLNYEHKKQASEKHSSKNSFLAPLSNLPLSVISALSVIFDILF